MIAADGVTILDDPFYEKNPRAFDGEGTPSEKTIDCREIFWASSQRFIE